MKRRDLLKAGGVVLTVGAHQIAHGATIVAVRLWPARDYTRVTIESDTLLASRTQVSTAPPRFIVDIDTVALDPAVRELVAQLRPDDPFIAGIRISQQSAGTTRMVVDLKQVAVPQAFHLPPIAAYKHRLVFDFYPLRQADPLEALIAELKDKPLPAKPALPAAPATTAVPAVPPAPGATASASAPDPLGELIAERSEREKRPSTTVAELPRPAKPQADRPDGSQGAGKTDRLIIIALDPGHGGEDPGAIGPGGTREKDIVLQVAHRLRERINATTVRGNPMRAFMTRDSDFFVPLNVRVQKAQRVQADLFVSIHADAFTEPTARGASVFALSHGGASSATARWLADKENRADLIGGVNIRMQDAHVSRALLDMSTTAQINDSLKLGSAVLGEIGNVGKLHKGKVEQAGFAVLKAPDIPSVLVETAFISNPDEEARLRSDDYQNQLADAIMRGIERYFSRNPPLARNRTV